MSTDLSLIGKGQWAVPGMRTMWHLGCVSPTIDPMVLPMVLLMQVGAGLLLLVCNCGVCEECVQGLCVRVCMGGWVRVCVCV